MKSDRTLANAGRDQAAQGSNLGPSDGVVSEFILTDSSTFFHFCGGGDATLLHTVEKMGEQSRRNIPATNLRHENPGRKSPA